jgi:site-specific recombinase XerC
MTTHAQQTNLKVLKGTAKSQVAQCVDLFLVDCEVRHLSPRTLHWYRENLEPFVRFLEEQHVGSLMQLQITSSAPPLVMLSGFTTSISAAAMHQRSISAWSHRTGALFLH